MPPAPATGALPAPFTLPPALLTALPPFALPAEPFTLPAAPALDVCVVLQAPLAQT